MRCVLVLSPLALLFITGCAVHQPKLTASQKLLLDTPALQSQAPTVKPSDVR